MPGADSATGPIPSIRVALAKSASLLIVLIVIGASYLANPRRGPPQPRLPRKAMSPRRAGGRCESTQWTPPQHATADHGQPIVRQEERASHALVSERRQVSGHRGNTHPAVQGRPAERSRLSSTVEITGDGRITCKQTNIRYSRSPVHFMGTPGMGMILWGASPLCETGSLKEFSIPNDRSD